MNVDLNAATSADIPKAFNRHVFMLSQALKRALAEQEFSSRLSNFAFWVQIEEPNPYFECKNAVRFDRRDNCVHSDICASYEKYLEFSEIERLDYFVTDIEKAIYQIPKKFLTTDDKALIICALTKIKRRVFLDLFGSEGAIQNTHESYPSYNAEITVQEQSAQNEIVLQWADGRATSENISKKDKSYIFDIYELEEILEGESNNLYTVDGHDIGCGKVNIFLDSKDREKALRHLAHLIDCGKLRPDIRIGIPEEGSGQYIAVYPDDLLEFSVI